MIQRCCEPGMPTPAGSTLSRRTFLMRSAGLALAVYGGRALAPRAFEEGIAAAQAQAAGQPVLVSIFMSGGVDSLSLLAPTGGAHLARYQQLRPSLALPRNDAHAFGADPSLQWHPNALAFRDLHAAGKLTVLPGVGYQDPNQSHFTSRHYWEVGALDPVGRFGWLGRYLDLHGSAENPLQGISLDWTLSPSIAAADVPVASVPDPAHFDFWIRNVWDSKIEGSMVPLLKRLGQLETSDPALGGARRVAARTAKLVEDLAPLQGAQQPYQTAVAYPDNGFAERLASLAEMLSRGMPVRVAALTANGGYDTHDNQASTFGDDVAGATQALAAFQADLEARGLADRVMTLVWSEFGRRPEQNANGTDHGAGGCAFLMGSRASGTMVGEFPGLSSLDAWGNLRHTVDFRAVYGALLDQWMGADPEAIIPGVGAFSLPTLVKP
ncbi:MAG: hypothetical protein QOD86_1000 [Miltoncostaeaceae bacterium]|jgi:uncharacterized protein (DUF1501 family)|nr:hypothetical protein [Miltoncostaeaceae bacterium]